MNYANTIAAELGIQAWQVAAAIELLDDANTIPFIARYRKEATGSLDEEQLRRIAKRLDYLRKLDARKAAVLAEIESQGKLTAELEQQIRDAGTLQQVEDLYLPYRPKRRTRATIARERGLEPLADLLLEQEPGLVPEQAAGQFLGEEVLDVETALAGARDIIAERVAEHAVVRELTRRESFKEGYVLSHLSTEDADPEGRYHLYHDFRAPLRALAPHQWLALRRGEAEGRLKVRIETPDEDIEHKIAHLFLTRQPTPAGSHVWAAIADGYQRLLKPAIDRELRARLGETADDHAIQVFATNLRSLLLQPPVKDRAVMGIDPGYRTGCKVATVDPTGKLLHTATIYPHPPRNEVKQALRVLRKLVEMDGITVIAIGNGTASRETELLVAEFIREVAGLAYVMVSEAGASVYSASALAREEFPDLDVSMRGAVSIARRLQDPLAELVKIDPKSIGVGLYQHDVDQKHLAQTLDAVVESVVNHVGVDVNTASAALLGYVSGISKRVAREIVAYRDANGPFRSRAELKNVKGLGDKAFQQAAGFLRIPGGRNPLDNTVIHPESYQTARELLDLAGLNLRMADLPRRLARFREQNDLAEVAEMLGVGLPTLTDIIDALIRPGRDPRDDLPKPVLRQDVLTIDDLREGMVLKGTVRNVVDFGAFVDIGLKHEGLVHVSNMAAHYVRNPHEIVSVGDIVDVRVLKVDRERGRIALSMVL
ncbi:MAG: RNA-binding transcriptional accessory protein [Caldilineae bacterium]|nr:MAG: RNA-binding transcriptional accessory protein [Caldilineae bacterium]